MAFDKTRPSSNDGQPSSKRPGSALDIDVDELLGIEEDKPAQPSNKKAETEEPVRREREPRKDTKGSPSSKMLIIGCISIALAVSAIAIGYSMSKSSKSKQVDLNQQTAATLDANKVESEDDTKKAGIDNLTADKQRKSTSDLSDATLITTDLNGKEIDTKYTIKSIKTVTEVVGYSKYRTQLGNGLEFYWLEVDYKGQPYKVQVPLSIYKELTSNKGYVVVDAEVTTTNEGSELITFMSVRKDQKSYLDKVGK